MLAIMQNSFCQPYFNDLWSILTTYLGVPYLAHLWMTLTKLVEKRLRVHQERSHINSPWEYKPNRLC